MKQRSHSGKKRLIAVLTIACTETGVLYLYTNNGHTVFLRCILDLNAQITEPTKMATIRPDRQQHFLKN
jgi:hypothetical protein